MDEAIMLQRQRWHVKATQWKMGAGQGGKGRLAGRHV